jgi:exodeoxyribonuclease VII large subunit
VATLAALAAEPEVDVIVLARGGGSFEDLLPFSDERVVRAVAASPVPVVSAVGHEQDTPLCDLAADARASTPTAAARLVVPDEGELRERLLALRASLARETGRTAARGRERLSHLHASLAREGTRTVARARERLEADRVRLHRAPAALLERRRTDLEGLAGRLRALCPQATLARGYAIVRAGDGVVRAGSAVAPGERVDVQLAEGGFGAVVEETR